MIETIEGDKLSRWLASEHGKPEWLIGYTLDDRSGEWRITDVQGQRFLLSELDADGVSTTGRTKWLLTHCVANEASLYSPDGDLRVFEAIQSSLRPLDVAAESGFAYLVQSGWPGSRKLGMVAIEMAELARKIGDPTLKVEDLERMATIGETDKSSALAVARWISRHLEVLPGLQQNERISAMLQASTLYRVAGRYDDAIAATHEAEELSAKAVPPRSLVALMVTRAAAMMDKAEHRLDRDKEECLLNAQRLLKRAFAISGGNPSNYQRSAYGRLMVLQGIRMATRS